MTVKTTAEFREAVLGEIWEAQLWGARYIDINAGDFHRKLGGYPAPQGKHRMSSCCSAMYSIQNTRYDVLTAPKKGKDASLAIRYWAEIAELTKDLRIVGV